VVPGASHLEGQVIADRYRILQQLGEGGMGRVYLAEHIKMGRRCAIKVMTHALMTDAEAIGRFNREARNASRILHPNVAAVYDFGESSDGLVYLAMELVEGEPLSAICERERIIPPARAIDITRQVADGLIAAHELGIVHRDLKPENIVVGRSKDGRDVVKIVDFGIAKGAQGERQNVTRTGFVVGTPEYMSPEQLAGEMLDGRSDLFALGCVLYKMLTGESSFTGPSIEARIQRRLTGPPPQPRAVNPAVPAWLDGLVTKMMARDPATRVQTAMELRDALVAGSESTSQRRRAVRLPTISRRFWFAAGALAGVTTLVSLGMSWRHNGSIPEQTPVSPRSADSVPTPPTTAAAPSPVGSTSVDSTSSAASAPQPTAGSPPASRRSDSLAVASQLALMSAQRRALDMRQRALDSGATTSDIERGDRLMKNADTAIARRHFAAAIAAIQDAEYRWELVAQAAGVAKRRAQAAADTHVAVVAEPPASLPAPPPPVASSVSSAPVKVAPEPSDPLPDIQAAIARYAQALGSRDVAQVRAAYPALSAEEAHRWQDVFDATNKLSATLTAVGPAHLISPTSAEVRVNAAFEFDYKHGIDGDRHPTATYHAILTRDGSTWKLTSIK
jgi:serine/threonine-protein kinase